MNIRNSKFRIVVRYKNWVSWINDDNTPLTAIFRTIRVSPYQNISILDFIRAKDDGGGGDNWSYKTCRSPVKSSPWTNHTQLFTSLSTLITTHQHQSTETSHSANLLTQANGFGHQHQRWTWTEEFRSEVEIDPHQIMQWHRPIPVGLP